MKVGLCFLFFVIVLFSVGCSNSGYQSPVNVTELFLKNNLSMDGLEFTESNMNKHGTAITALYFEQYVNGLRVYPATIYYYFKDGKYVGTSINRITQINVSTVPRLSAEDVKSIAHNKTPVILKKLRISELPTDYEVSLIYYVDYNDGKTKSYILAYLVKPDGIENLDLSIVFDANSGEILDDGIRFVY